MTNKVPILANLRSTVFHPSLAIATKTLGERGSPYSGWSMPSRITCHNVLGVGLVSNAALVRNKSSLQQVMHTNQRESFSSPKSWHRASQRSLPEYLSCGLLGFFNFRAILVLIS